MAPRMSDAIAVARFVDVLGCGAKFREGKSGYRCPQCLAYDERRKLAAVKKVSRSHPFPANRTRSARDERLRCPCWMRPFRMEKYGDDKLVLRSVGPLVPQHAAPPAPGMIYRFRGFARRIGDAKALGSRSMRPRGFMDDCYLLDTLRAFNERLLIIEAPLGLSMTCIDKLIVDDILKSQEAAKAAEEAKIAAFHEAEAEAERVGKSKPIDDFTC
jgi:hypothetical protein